MEQMDSILQELFFNRWFGAISSPCMEKAEPESGESAEPVKSLVREKNGVLSFTPCELFEVKLGGYERSKNSWSYLTKTIAAKFVRPRILAGKEEEVFSHIEKEFMPYETNIVPHSGASRLFTGGSKPVTSFCWRVENPVLSDTDEITYHFFSSKDSVVKKDRFHYCWFTFDKDREQIYVDWSRFLAECIVYSKVLKKLRDLKEMTPEEREEDVFFDRLLRQRCSDTIKVPETDLALQERLKGLGFSVEKASVRGVYPEYEESIALFFMKKRFFYSPELILLSHQCRYRSRVPFLCGGLYMQLYGSYQEDKQTYKYCRETEGSYAASYEEKKNIPQRTRDAMEKSAFRTYFSTVEYDESVDLKKAELVARDFEVLAKLFKLPFLDGYSLRFRLLGKHHAAGLYFPFHRCLCVDVREPSSMAHELLHLLDFKLGCKSKGVSFQRIRDAYASLVEENVRKSPDDLARWNGSSKYNKKYYLEPTEVFARCGELFLTRELGLKSACVSKETASGFAYPEDERFQKMIAEYFNELFQLNSSERKAA